MPASWKDLTKPVYKGHVIMPNPNSSGTGFLDVSSWLQMFGEEEGWKFMDALHENIARYTHSGSKPCKLAAAGEIPIGISFAFRGAKSKAAGAPLEIIVPSEGVGWDMEAAAIVKGTKKMDAAKKLMDFLITKEANEMYNAGYAVVAYPGVAKPVEHFPEGLVDAMIDNGLRVRRQQPGENPRRMAEAVRFEVGTKGLVHRRRHRQMIHRSPTVTLTVPFTRVYHSCESLHQLQPPARFGIRSSIS